MKELLSNSRVMCFKECPKRYELRYVRGIRLKETRSILTRGTSFHAAIEAVARGASFEEIGQKILSYYLDVPDGTSDAVKALRLVQAYIWYWQSQPLDYHAKELTVNVPLVNPVTGRSTPNYDTTVIMDGVAEYDGRVVIVDHKTTTHDISEGSDYRAKLYLDPQISLYMLAARQAGINAHSFLYDMVHWPGFEPKQAVLRDLSELADAGTYFAADMPPQVRERVKDYLAAKKTGDKFVELRDMFGARVLSAILENPTKYFQRAEVVRTDADLEEFAKERWADQKMLRFCQNAGYYPKNPASCITPFRCDYLPICSNGIRDLEALPEIYTTTKGTPNGTNA